METRLRRFGYIVLGLALGYLITQVGSQQLQLNVYRATQTASEMEVHALQQQVAKLDSTVRRLNEVHPSLGKGKWSQTICKTGTFLGFLLTEPVDTAVTNALKEALTAYSGPEAKINSLRRHYNKSSEHYHGRAVDLAWDEDVIEYLLSEDGQKWLCAHGLCFYIEGKPGSRKVAKYNKRPEARKFVFHNPEATGDHIHLNLT